MEPLDIAACEQPTHWFVNPVGLKSLSEETCLARNGLCGQLQIAAQMLKSEKSMAGGSSQLDLAGSHFFHMLASTSS